VDVDGVDVDGVDVEVDGVEEELELLEELPEDDVLVVVLVEELELLVLALGFGLSAGT
jgi:hypothetical protein